ncbi:hypothetical protein LEN26_000319 [Aphanomyces euteiches]|nr:hypothetical protein AeMF1_019128 [Aphanomyces euteiches]KAH9163817.1 hypothetical protein LEN26_000319 [Aphanomyces euteiches]KAH9195918.1 hypothetical protein AeNC1_002107 [Aphanomyces euteiches]
METEESQNARRSVPVLNIVHNHSVSADSASTHEVPFQLPHSLPRRRMLFSPMTVVYILVGVCAVVGAIIGIVVTVQYNNLDDDKSSQTDQDNPQSTSNSTTTPSVTPPPSAVYQLRIFALGAWGADPDFVDKADGQHRFRDETDRQAQADVAALMASSASTQAPQLIISQGNNFNWYGLLATNDTDIAGRVDASFTSVYNQPSLASIPWSVIMGENDYGGGEFLCGDSEDKLHACGNEAAIIAGLQQKFKLQQQATSSSRSKKSKKKTKRKLQSVQDSRWTMANHYMKQSLVSPDNSVSIDIFHVDVTVHAAPQICCQCLGYAPPDMFSVSCPMIQPHDDYCAGGDMNSYNACLKELATYAKSSLDQFQLDAAASTATFKIVNGHLSPFEMSKKDRDRWLQAISKAGIHLWLHGHVPGMNHVRTNQTATTASRRLKSHHEKYVDQHQHRSSTTSKEHDVTAAASAAAAALSTVPVTHFMTNGIGGGVPMELLKSKPVPDAVDLWALSERKYGFLDIAANATCLRVVLRTTDKMASYCYDISRTQGDVGRACS